MPDILILMATRNGERFLPDQLASIAAQSHRGWRLLISDDASTDRSRQIIGDFIRTRPEGQVALVPGPGRGATENFRSLLRQADLGGSHLAFSDQDDVWERDHLSRAVESLSRLSVPLAVYGCRMRICDESLKPIGLSAPAAAPLGFRNALVQNMLSGNTMVMTSAAAHLLQGAERRTGPVPVHDWWAYQMITGAGGAAVLDPAPGVLYRQHDSNVIGLDRGLRALSARVRGHLGGRSGTWARQNSAALGTCAALLTPENRRCLEAFTRALSAPLPQKIAGLRRSGIYHQSRRDRLAFWLLVALGRF
ncbi:glycosyltransferase [Paracoccus sp. YIM 132242]|uniref:Glycosyltransferase n=1 Tax=Paracoccus lichenicola TaxID=2665644 RepID=A0A6L6HRE8_9RHOB|nr:glycosyltransferase [Paracoccus lichenicola]MTE01756.1 glycosyltransferase [Paracoccus lichenicola]